MNESPTGPHPHQDMALSVFQILFILTDTQQCLSVVSPCISLMTYDAEHILYVSFGEVSVKVFGPFFNQVFHFLILELSEFFYILGDSSLSDMSFANTFPHSVACLLIFFTVSFAEQIF